MKHIFVVHSNITYLSALGVIAREQIAPADYILVSEGFSSAPLPVVAMPYWHGLRANRWCVKHYLRPAQTIDNHLKRLTLGEPFTLYFSVANKLARTLLTHPECLDFCFIEEGLSAYSLRFSITTLTAYDQASGWRPKGLLGRFKTVKLGLLRGYTPRLAALPIFYSAYADPGRKYYGFTEHSHILAPPAQRRMLDMRALQNRFDLQPTIDINQCTIWLGDCVDSSDLDGSTYFKGFETGFICNALLSQNITNIFVKFHYRETQASRSHTLALLARHNIKAEVLPDSTLLEIELLFARGVKLYGTYSSLLLYGSLAGVESWSIDRYYGQGVMDERIPLFWNYVKRL